MIGHPHSSATRQLTSDGTAKLSNRSLKRLAEHVTGDAKLTRYRSGPVLVTLFNGFGCNDLYGSEFPARWKFAEDRLRDLNGNDALHRLIEAVFDPVKFLGVLVDGAPVSETAAIADMNQYLARDGLRIDIDNRGAHVRTTAAGSVTLPAAVYAVAAAASIEFIEEQIDKCKAKLANGDSAGAITNARSLCEDVLRDIEHQRDASAPAYNGDLPKLYKRLRKLLKLDPDGQQQSVAVLQLLTGLTTTVAGLAGISNELGDRHGGRTSKPKLHHAQLAVDTAQTLCAFALSSHAHQNTKPAPKTTN